ncbi:MipA/OmpV family protein [Methylibium sp.]|uniref:MipA/OmpV family protein n=1 Tax=Methylibium sp. TaxID=2067992 RepID=UPI003D13DF12
MSPPALLLVAAGVGGLLCTPAVAEDSRADRPLSFEAGAGVARLPDYSGSGTSSARARIWVDADYRTERFGTVSLDSGSLTLPPALRWAFIDDQRAGMSVLLGYRSGRGSSRPSFGSTADGSERLQGLPDVPGAVDAGVEGHVAVFGVPVFAQLRSALRGPQGSTLNVGIYAPLQLTTDVELTLLPTLTWNNARQARAFYGVEAAGAAASGYAEFRPGASWQNAAVEIALDWRLASHWHLLASVAWLRLMGDAARSPLVQEKQQNTALVGLAWKY